MIRLFSLIVTAFLFFQACTPKVHLPKAERVQLYKNFDLFTLQGIEPIKKRSGKNWVKVGYSSQMQVPLYFLFVKKKDDIAFVLKDSFALTSPESKTIYVYHTKNFFGEKIGRKRLYRWYYYDQVYDVYIDMSNSVLCRFIELYPKYSSASMDMYRKDPNGEIKGCLSGYKVEEYTNNAVVELYLKWIEDFKKTKEDQWTTPTHWPGMQQKK